MYYTWSKEFLEAGKRRLAGDTARSKGMAMIAEQTGLAREALYKSLSADGNPRLTTLLSVLKAMGLRLSVTVDEHKAA
jgi:probable addiction module antidote protein